MVNFSSSSISVIALILSSSLIITSCSTTRTGFLRNEPLGSSLNEKNKKTPISKLKVQAGAVALTTDNSAILVPIFQSSVVSTVRTFQMKSQKVYDSFCNPGYRFDENCETSYGRIFLWDFILGPASLWMIPYFSAEEKRGETSIFKDDKMPLNFRVKETAIIADTATNPFLSLKPTISVCDESMFSESVEAFKPDRGDTTEYNYVKKLLAEDYQLSAGEIDQMDYFVFMGTIEEPLLGPGPYVFIDGNLEKFKIKDSSVIQQIKERSIISEVKPVMVQRIWLGVTPEIFEEPKERAQFSQTARFPHFNDIQTESLMECSPVTDLQMLQWVKDYNSSVRAKDQKISLYDLNLKAEIVQRGEKFLLKVDVKKLGPFLRRLKNDLVLNLGVLGTVKVSPAAFN